MRYMKGYVSGRPGEGMFKPKHTHYYEKTMPCFAHGANCTVGLCVGCWLYEGKKTVTHFMPTILNYRGNKGKKGKKGRRNK